MTVIAVLGIGSPSPILFADCLVTHNTFNHQGIGSDFPSFVERKDRYHPIQFGGFIDPDLRSKIYVFHPRCALLTAGSAAAIDLALDRIHKFADRCNDVAKIVEECREVLSGSATSYILLYFLNDKLKWAKNGQSLSFYSPAFGESLAIGSGAVDFSNYIKTATESDMYKGKSILYTKETAIAQAMLTSGYALIKETFEPDVLYHKYGGLFESLICSRERFEFIRISNFNSFGWIIELDPDNMKAQKNYMDVFFGIKYDTNNNLLCTRYKINKETSHGARIQKRDFIVKKKYEDYSNVYKFSSDNAWINIYFVFLKKHMGQNKRKVPSLHMTEVDIRTSNDIKKWLSVSSMGQNLLKIRGQRGSLHMPFDMKDKKSIDAISNRIEQIRLRQSYA